ncbi:glycoside hydrolase family 15 protein [Propionivibrio sp.]|uniref:glycoside hydrolase family 15 protein n=1 Tax=Propionivibrio sp. TaxID=2212460 RepID=UPI0039E65F82
MSHLNLGLIGNGAVSALIDDRGRIVWSCFPRFDGDPVFCHLLQPGDHETGRGAFGIELVDFSHAQQHYEANTAVLTTLLHDRQGGCLEITDFAPRFRLFGRMFHPMMLVRQVRRVAGAPRMAVNLQPLFNYGGTAPEITFGSHHVRYVGAETALRLTTDASINAVLERREVFVEDTLTFMLGADETLHEAVAVVGRRFLEETKNYWHAWVRSLFVPVDWQDEVIRAAITLQLNACEDTGAIVAAMTTSLPEHADSGRNWDYRYCWLRDGYFVVNALNRLGATRTMEKYLSYILNVAAGHEHGMLQPVYGISGEKTLHERTAPALAGYRAMGPVRMGNLAYAQVQHDVYGSAILSATHMFFDHRLFRRGDVDLFHRLEPLGQKALANFDQPDAGLWELRGRQRVHTYSSVICWAACDRLSRIARQLGLGERQDYWRGEADRMHEIICREAWHEGKQAFVAAWGDDALDASMLLLHEFGFLAADDPRFASTVAAIEAELKHGDFIYRYVEQDDFGTPDNAFLVCTFWYVYALQALGRKDEACHTFETLLGCCNPLGLLAEDYCERSGELWGNFVQTYSMVGLINCALRLSRRWDQAY